MNRNSTLVFILVVALFAGCKTLPRYTEASVNLPRDIYTQDIDPNDPIYKVMSHPPDTWRAQFGDSERSALAYQHALARQQRAELRQAITELTDTQLWLMKIIGRDPKKP